MSDLKVNTTKPASSQVPPKAAPLEAKPKPTHVTALFGRMVHPYTGQVFDLGKGVEVWNVDNWIEVQIEAGKMNYVTE